MLRCACEALIITRETSNAPFSNDVSVLSRLFYFLFPKVIPKTNSKKLLFYDVGVRTSGKLFWAACKVHEEGPVTSVEEEDARNRWTLVPAKDTQSHPLSHLLLLDLIKRSPAQDAESHANDFNRPYYIKIISCHFRYSIHSQSKITFHLFTYLNIGMLILQVHRIPIASEI